MKVKFNHFERVAGLFVLACIVGLFVALVGVAVKQGWFESRVKYTTVFQNGEGLHPGTVVQLAGLRAGAVDEVELTHDNHVKIHFSILARFEGKVREDSVASLVRPFIIGDRIVDISLGSDTASALPAGQEMQSHENIDLMTVLSGRKLGDYLESMGGMMESLKILATGFLSKDRTQSLLKLMDRIDPLIENVNTMALEMTSLSKQATRNENLGKVMAGLRITTGEINQVLPKVREVMPVVTQLMPVIQEMIPEVKDKAPALARNLEQLVGNLALMTEQFKVVLPALSEIAPQLPRTTRRAVEALDEAVVLMKAMQKSWIIRSAAKEVRDEEGEHRDERQAAKPGAEDAPEVKEPVKRAPSSDLEN